MTVQLVVFTVLFVAVAVIGFVAARWRRPDVDAPPRRVGPWRPQLRRLGHVVSDRRRPLHRVHVHRGARAAVRGGRGRLLRDAVHGASRIRSCSCRCSGCGSVSHKHGFVTPADFVRARFGSPTLALLVALTGIVATMPYIALQLVGIEAVLKAMGVTGDAAADHRVRDPRRVHVPVRPARAGADRVRQGRADLHRDHRGDRVDPARARRLGRDLRRRAGEVRAQGRVSCSRRRTSSST